MAYLLEDKIIVRKRNHVFLTIETTEGIERELSDYFRFEPQNAFWKKRQNPLWDGYIRLFNRRTNTIYVGLLEQLRQFAEEREYGFEVQGEMTDGASLSYEAAKKFYDGFNLPSDKQARDYQIRALTDAVTHNRLLFLSATASGKSLILYALCRYYNTKSLIIVPTTSLIWQMSGDFKEYALNEPSFDADLNCHQIFSGQDKNSPAQIYISTWQSLQKMPQSYFNQFGLVIADEAHGAKAKELTGILEKMTNTPYRFGTTGTLDGIDCHELILTGLFGKKVVLSTTRELIKRNILPDIKVNVVHLKYSDATRKSARKLKYREELELLFNNKARNTFIANLALSQKSNTLVLFREVEKHGKVLHERIQKLAQQKQINRNIYFIHGGVDAEERDLLRKIVETETNAIIVASQGVFSTGINIPSLDVLIFASPSKARIKIIQSIGRILRKGKNTVFATVYDIVDDLSWKNKKNYAMKHFLERARIYDSEQHQYRTFKLEIKDAHDIKSHQTD